MSSACQSVVRAIALAVVVCATLHGIAAAQSPQDIAQAKTLLLEGRDLLASHQTTAACEKFEASIALDPTAPGVMLNLGLCNELLERYATSLYWFRKAQAAAAEAKLPDYEEEAKRHTIALANKVSVTKLDLSAAPADTEILIDGKLIAPTDYVRVEIDRGSHTLEARASGKQGYRKSFVVSSVDAGTIVVPELADEAPRPQRTPDSAATDTGSSRLGRTVLAASFGVVGLGLCVASPLWARRIKQDYDHAVANMEMPSWSDARNKQHIATGMFVAGLGLIGFGTYLYLSGPSQSSSALAISPAIGDGQLGVAVSGSL